MDLGIIIALGVVAFGFGCWFVKITSQLNRIDRSIIPLVLLHKEDGLNTTWKKEFCPILV
jgi:hypothetical protein